MERKAHWCVAIFAAAQLLVAHDAFAEPVRLHGLLGVAHAVVEPQQSDFGFGGQGNVALEYAFSRFIGLQAELGLVVLAPGSPSTDPAVASKSTGVAFTTMLGVRIHPLVHPGGLWLDANGGAAFTGDLARPSFDAHVGWDFWIGSIGIGPYVGYTHVFELGLGLNPNDGHVLGGGVSLGWGERQREREHQVIRGDRDHDGVFDDEDACPSVFGRRTNDPKTNGCPRADRDGDGVFDDEDACPDVKGVRTSDPKTNGCPSDRDGDGVPDASDACPDVPGVATNDPKTNGCPPAADVVRVEGDRIVIDDIIHFDTDDARVHHGSLPLVKKIADMILANPNILEVKVVGHADHTGTEEHNKILSRERAISVRRLLISFNVDAARLTTEAFGDTKPRVEGNDAAALSANRRVEFIIMKTRPITQPAPKESSP